MDCKGTFNKSKIFIKYDKQQYCAFNPTELCGLNCAACRLSDKQADGLQFIICARMPQYALAEYIQDIDLEYNEAEAPFDEESVTVDDSE